MGCFCKQNLITRPFKNSPIWSHCSCKLPRPWRVSEPSHIPGQRRRKTQISQIKSQLIDPSTPTILRPGFDPQVQDTSLLSLYLNCNEKKMLSKQKRGRDWSILKHNYAVELSLVEPTFLRLRGDVAKSVEKFRYLNRHEKAFANQSEKDVFNKEKNCWSMIMMKIWTEKRIEKEAHIKRKGHNRKSKKTGSGCGSIGRAVACDTRSLRFKSSHRQNSY